MAKVKFYKVTESQLSSLPIVEGQIIFVTDAGQMYVDTDNNTRAQIKGAGSKYGLSLDENGQVSLVENGSDASITLPSDVNTTYSLSKDNQTLTFTGSDGTTQNIILDDDIRISDTEPDGDWRIWIDTSEEDAIVYTNDGIEVNGTVTADDFIGTVNGYTIAKSVPSDAVFTDTTYNNATTSSDGLMSSTDKTKLDGLNNYDDTSLSTRMSTAEENITTLNTNMSNKVDKITGKGLSEKDYTSTEKTKLSGIADGATKVEASTTNGNIKINGTETTIYTKPALTSSEISTALGYTPVQTDTNTTYTFETGDANGQIKVTPLGGSAQNISVKGLGNLAYLSSLSASDVGALATSLKGANSGLAELDANGKVPSSQLPSFVDDVLEYNGQANFPSTGESGKIYVDTATNITYRWSGTAYVAIGSDLALGTTSSTAYRGDLGAAAYAHAVTNKGSAFASGLYKITVNSEGHVTAATAVTKADITTLGIPGSDTTYESKTAASGGTDLSLVTTGEKYTWNNKSNLTIGTTGITAAAGNHTHSIDLATDTGTSTLTLASAGKYKLTAGGDSLIFTMPTIPTTLKNPNALSLQVNGTTKISYDGSTANQTFNIATGSADGNISVAGTDVAVKGLAAAAYKGVDTSLTTSSSSTNVPTSAAIATLLTNQLSWKTV